MLRIERDVNGKISLSLTGHMEAADIEELRRLFGLEPALNGIVLNRPENHNALSASLVANLLEALRDLIDGDARVVLVGAPRGARVWSAGHDLTELPTNGCDPLTYDDPLRQLVRAFKESPAPIIAMVEGGSGAVPARLS